MASIRFLVGATAGEWQSLNQVTPTDFYLWGRAVTALMGTATVLLVYLIGMRWGTRYAALSAGLLAVMPIHVRESHYILTDVPVTFFVTLTFLLSLRANERERAAAFAWAGAAAGLATATKYPGALALLLPLIAAWMTPGTRPSRLIATAATLGAFLVNLSDRRALYDPRSSRIPERLRAPGWVLQQARAGRSGGHHLFEASAQRVALARVPDGHRGPDPRNRACRARSRTGSAGRLL